MPFVIEDSLAELTFSQTEQPKGASSQRKCPSTRQHGAVHWTQRQKRPVSYLQSQVQLVLKDPDCLPPGKAAWCRTPGFYVWFSLSLLGALANEAFYIVRPSTNLGTVLCDWVGTCWQKCLLLLADLGEENKAPLARASEANDYLAKRILQGKNPGVRTALHFRWPFHLIMGK